MKGVRTIGNPACFPGRPAAPRAETGTEKLGRRSRLDGAALEVCEEEPGIASEAEAQHTGLAPPLERLSDFEPALAVDGDEIIKGDGGEAGQQPGRPKGLDTAGDLSVSRS